VDRLTERKIFENLESLRCTRILATHRLYVAARADRVVVIEGGRIVEQGTLLPASRAARVLLAHVGPEYGSDRSGRSGVEPPGHTERHLIHCAYTCPALSLRRVPREAARNEPVAEFRRSRRCSRCSPPAVVDLRCNGPTTILPVKIKYGGRAVAIATNPADDKAALVVSESGGIFQTRNYGQPWFQITGRTHSGSPTCIITIRIRNILIATAFPGHEDREQRRRLAEHQRRRGVDHVPSRPPDATKPFEAYGIAVEPSDAHASGSAPRRASSRAPTRERPGPFSQR
jgi:hypothetical protein